LDFLALFDFLDFFDLRPLPLRPLPLLRLPPRATYSPLRAVTATGGGIPLIRVAAPTVEVGIRVAVAVAPVITGLFSGTAFPWTTTSSKGASVEGEGGPLRGNKGGSSFFPKNPENQLI